VEIAERSAVARIIQCPCLLQLPLNRSVSQDLDQNPEAEAADLAHPIPIVIERGRGKPDNLLLEERTGWVRLDWKFSKWLSVVDLT
jgi:hypothetical protein